jgi:Spy/CpxP family protein refolding chaperone
MKLSLIAFILSLFSVSAFAQIERRPVLKTDSAHTSTNDNEVDKQNRKERFKELDLTLEQKRKMKEIMQSNKAAKEAIENNTQLSEQEQKKQLRGLQRSQMTKVQTVLTPEQREKFKASRQNNP